MTTSQGQRFRRRALRRGYKVDEVDAFLDRVEATLAGDPVGNPVTGQEVHDVVFRVRFGGYDEWQVDLHLDRVERQLSDLEERTGVGGGFGRSVGTRPMRDELAEPRRPSLPPPPLPPRPLAPMPAGGPAMAGPAMAAAPMSAPPMRPMSAPPLRPMSAPPLRPMSAPPMRPLSAPPLPAGPGGYAPPGGGYPPAGPGYAPAGPGYPPPGGGYGPVGPGYPPPPGAGYPPPGQRYDDTNGGGFGGMPAGGGFGPPPGGDYSGRRGRMESTHETRYDLGGSMPVSGGPASPTELQRIDQMRRTFTARRFGSGYDAIQVNRLFDAIIASLSGRSGMPLSEQELDPNQFSLVPGGYFEAEVNQALREVRDLVRR